PVSRQGETLWYDVNGARALVKLQSGAAVGELAALRSGEQTGTVRYRDPQVGYSFTIPAGWMFHSRPAGGGTGTAVDLFDPESHGDWIIIACKKKKTAPDEIPKELQQGADVFKRDRRPNLSPSTVVHYKIGGHEALSLVAEAGGWTTETIWVQSE